MRKIISIFAFAAVAFLLGSCDTETNEKPGGTAIQDMCGTWTITITESVDEFNYFYGDGFEDPEVDEMSPAQLDGIEWEDFYDAGITICRTFNTASNTTDKMWFLDSEFWGAQILCDVNYGELTFKSDSYVPYEDCEASIIGGKILKNAAKTAHGAPVDSIIAYVRYSDSEDFTTFKFSGKRYTGFPEDEQ